MADLKPCPFCGYKGVEILADDNKYLYYRYFSQCQRCGAGAKRGHTKEDAAKEWNRRADGVHGRWEMRPTGMVTDTGPEYKAYCTVCNEPNKQYQPPFCLHCGAKMDGGDGHEAD